jgi:hypothetical protein
LTIGPATAAQLGRVQAGIPGSDEVIASQGVIGRFANRQLIFPFLDVADEGQIVPVFGRPVVVVLTDDGIEYATAAGTARAVAYLRSLGARPLAAGAGVYAFEWLPPPGTRRLVFPPTG